MTTSHTLSAEALTLGYGDRTIIDGLDLVLPPGRITAIVGANGCGKSTLLRALARLIAPKEGRVLLDGAPLQTRPSKEIARTLGLLPQSPTAPEGIAVADLVGRGRHPHQKLLARWSERDYEVVSQSLQATGTADLADRAVDELSGGQRQRVWIAVASIAGTLSCFCRRSQRWATASSGGPLVSSAVTLKRPLRSSMSTSTRPPSRLKPGSPSAQACPAATGDAGSGNSVRKRSRPQASPAKPSWRNCN